MLVSSHEEVNIKLKDPDYYRHQLEKLEETSLPIKDKLLILDRDILALKLTDRTIDKRIQRMHRLVKIQMGMICLNLSVGIGMVVLILRDIVSKL